MKKYLEIIINCYSHKDMICEYETKYKDKYQLIGYEHSMEKQVGKLILYKRQNIDFKRL